MIKNKYIVFQRRYYYNYTAENIYLLRIYCKYTNQKFKYTTKYGNVSDAILLIRDGNRLILSSSYFSTKECTKHNNNVVKLLI